MIHAALLVAATAIGATALPPRPPDATYVYTMTYAGTQIGSSTVTIDGTTPGAIVVKESASFTLPSPFTATTTMHYDAATLHETSYTGDFNLPRGPQRTDVTIKDGVANVTITGQRGTTIPAEASAPLELIGDNMAASGMFVPALLHATGAQTFTLAVLSGNKAIVATVGTNDAPRPASVPAADASLTLNFSGLSEIYWYDPRTYVVHDVQVPAQQGEFRLTTTGKTITI
jgi:hypothetical protein